EVLGVRPEAYGGAAFARPDRLHLLQRILELAVAGEGNVVQAAVALDVHFQAGGERIGHAHAHAVQAAGDAVGRFLVGLAELAARVQRGEDHLHGGNLLFRVDVHRNAPAVVVDLGRAVLVQGDGDVFGKARQALIR